MKRFVALAAASAFATGLALPAAAQTKWDLPSAYPASNYHTENLQQFANDVDKASGGKLKIQLHPNASLFKAPEIKRAVQGNQAQTIYHRSRRERCGRVPARPAWNQATSWAAS